MLPRTANATKLSSLVIALALLTAVGCQERPVIDRLPSANFNGPLVPPPPAPPAPVYEQPKPAPKVVKVEPKKPVPQLAGIPREWTPTPGATNPDGWRYIVIHHSATPTGGAKAFDRMHREKGWDELGYHFVVGNGTDTADGQIEVGSRWPKQKWGAHAKTPNNMYNRQGIGICLVGNFDNDRLTTAQTRSLAKLVAYMMRTYNIPADHVIGHGDTKATDCPGRNVHVADIRRLATQLAAIDTPAALAQTPTGELLVDVAAK